MSRAASFLRLWVTNSSSLLFCIFWLIIHFYPLLIFFILWAAWRECGRHVIMQPFVSEWQINLVSYSKHSSKLREYSRPQTVLSMNQENSLTLIGNYVTYAVGSKKCRSCFQIFSIRHKVQKLSHIEDWTSSQGRTEVTSSRALVSCVLMEKELNNSPICYLSSCQRHAFMNWLVKSCGLLFTTILQRLEPMTAGRRAASGGEGRVIVSPALIN